MQKRIVDVGDWRVAADSNQISRQGRQVSLEPRLVDLLVYFAGRPDEVISTDEIIENVWTRSVVTSHVVTQSISVLRKALREGAGDYQEYIVTVPRRGYKLVAPVKWHVDKKGAEEEDALRGNTDPSGINRASGMVPADVDRPPGGPEIRRCRPGGILTWCAFGLSAGVLLFLIAILAVTSRPPVVSNTIMLHPDEMDIRFEESQSCSNWKMSELVYVNGIGNLISATLNTYSGYRVHDHINNTINMPVSSGKSLTIKFVNQHHYRAQQCFMSVVLYNNVTRSVMLDKRYFITDNTLLSIQADLFNSLSVALGQVWPEQMKRILDAYQVSGNAVLKKMYAADFLIAKGDMDALDKASVILADVIKMSPGLSVAFSTKVLVDVLRDNQQPFTGLQRAALDNDISGLSENNGDTVFFKIKTIELLENGHIDEAGDMVNKSLARETSWLNYLLLGKVVEMKGDTRQAADAYMMAFTLRPGNNTRYWIENGLFRTSLEKTLPWLMRLSEEDAARG